MGLAPRKVTVQFFQQVLKTNPTSFIRYRTTATLISLILEAGYQCPHRTLDEYVHAFTGFMPTDGKDWTNDEPQLPSHFNLKDLVKKLNFEKMGESSHFLYFGISTVSNHFSCQ
jgi:hypothetical protein